MADTFTLKSAPVPTISRGSGGKYKQVLDEFVKSGLKSALVGGYTAKTASVAVGLRKLAEKLELPVAVKQVGAEVYLIRVEQPKPEA